MPEAYHPGHSLEPRFCDIAAWLITIALALWMGVFVVRLVRLGKPAIPSTVDGEHAKIVIAERVYRVRTRELA